MQKMNRKDWRDGSVYNMKSRGSVSRPIAFRQNFAKIKINRHPFRVWICPSKGPSWIYCSIISHDYLQSSLHNSNKETTHSFPVCCTDNTLSISPDSEDSPWSNLGKQDSGSSINVCVQSLSPKLLGTKPLNNLHPTFIEILIVLWNLSSMIVCESRLWTRTRAPRNGRRCKMVDWHQHPEQNLYYPLEQSGSRPAWRGMNLVFGNVQTIRRFLRGRKLFSEVNRQPSRVIIANLVRLILT
jgi:hypothetical protein